MFSCFSVSRRYPSYSRKVTLQFSLAPYVETVSYNYILEWDKICTNTHKEDLPVTLIHCIHWIHIWSHLVHAWYTSANQIPLWAKNQQSYVPVFMPLPSYFFYWASFYHGTTSSPKTWVRRDLGYHHCPNHKASKWKSRIEEWLSNQQVIQLCPDCSVFFFN